MAGIRAPVQWVKVCKRSFAETLKGTTCVSMPTHGCCERVARERAGGERGLLFAGQKANRVPPSNKAASEAVAATMRRLLNAGRRKFKRVIENALESLRKRQKGTGEKRRAFPRMDAR